MHQTQLDAGTSQPEHGYLQLLNKFIGSGARGKMQRSGVHAVAQPGGPRPVIKYMAQLPIAAPARYRGAPHAEAIIRAFQYIVFRYRLPEARPAGAGFKLGAGIEQRRLAADAIIQSVGALVPQCTGERLLSAGSSGVVGSRGR